VGEDVKCNLVHVECESRSGHAGGTISCTEGESNSLGSKKEPGSTPKQCCLCPPFCGLGVPIQCLGIGRGCLQDQVLETASTVAGTQCPYCCQLRFGIHGELRCRSHQHRKTRSQAREETLPALWRAPRAGSRLGRENSCFHTRSRRGEGRRQRPLLQEVYW
jgi:hypothetical protein